LTRSDDESSREALSSPESQITKKKLETRNVPGMKLIEIYGNHKADTWAWFEGTSTGGNPTNRKHIFMISHDNSTLLELDAFSRQKSTALSINSYLPSLINNRREIKHRREMKSRGKCFYRALKCAAGGQTRVAKSAQWSPLSCNYRPERRADKFPWA
jgi:hypothetical protein